MNTSLYCMVGYLLLCEAERETSGMWSVFLRINAVVFSILGLMLMIDDIFGALL